MPITIQTLRHISLVTPSTQTTSSIEVFPNAVDELMNISDSPEDPISASRVIQALADRNGLSPRQVTLEWFDRKLTSDEQKDFPPLAFGVGLDPDVDQDSTTPDFLSADPYTFRSTVDYLATKGVIDSTTLDPNELYIYITNEFIDNEVNEFGHHVASTNIEKLRAVILGGGGYAWFRAA